MEYRTQLISKNRKQRPGYAMTPESITVHNTANPNATAANHADYLSNADRSASWHIAVDDVEAVLHIPLDEQAWHTGTNAGNKTSIGIEVCEFSDKERQDAADRNAQKLIAEMLTGKAPSAFRVSGLDVGDVRTHQSWKQYGATGKYCPRMILPWWDSFIAGIEAEMNGAEPVAPKLNKSKNPVLRSGARGEYVKNAQKRLKVHGADIADDGIFGKNTLAAVKAFQKQKKLTVDGIIGKNTWAALAKAPSNQPLLKLGNVGSYVRTVQQILRTKKYHGADGKLVRVDGIFGGNTYHAVRDFQKHEKIGVDGIVGKETWKKLGY